MSKFAAIALAGTIAAISQALGSTGSASISPDGSERHSPAVLDPRSGLADRTVVLDHPTEQWARAEVLTPAYEISMRPDPTGIGPVSEPVRSRHRAGSEPAGRVEAAHSVPFTITAYAQKRRGRVFSTARTRTGTRPAVGRTVAVDPRIIPLGSRVYIEGIGERIAEDTGRLIKGRRIDLFVDSHEEGIQFGVRRGARVRIVALGDREPAPTSRLD